MSDLNKKVLFLDIDGVLNNSTFLRECFDKGIEIDQHMDPQAIARLNKVVEATGCEIVVSSTWRIPYVMGHRISDLRGLLRRHGVQGVIRGATPIHKDAFRGGEIQAWLNQWADALNIDSFVIIDDDNDMGQLKNRLVKTTFQNGMQDVHVDDCIKMFNTPLTSPLVVSK